MYEGSRKVCYEFRFPGSDFAIGILHRASLRLDPEVASCISQGQAFLVRRCR